MYHVLNLPRELGADISTQAAHQLKLRSLPGRFLLWQTRQATSAPRGWKSLWPHHGAIGS